MMFLRICNKITGSDIFKYRKDATGNLGTSQRMKIFAVLSILANGKTLDEIGEPCKMSQNGDCDSFYGLLNFHNRILWR